MWGAWILLVSCITVVASQNRNVEYVDYVEYVDVAGPQERFAQEQPPPRTRAPTPQHKPRRPSDTGKKANKPRGTTPVPIIKDIRRVDPHTGAFYYHYEGGDGSMKHEVRFPNGTVLGNYTYVKENGELETHTYHHGLGTNIIENDNGNYDLHRHLEEAYVHQSGPDPVEELFPEDSQLQPNSVRSQSHGRPSFAAPQPRPQPRPSVSRDVVRPQSRPRPAVREQAPSDPRPVPLDYHDSQFSFQDERSQNFNPNAVDDQQPQASNVEYEYVYYYDDDEPLS